MKLKHFSVSVQVTQLIVMCAMFIALLSMASDIHQMAEAMFEENSYYSEGTNETPDYR